MKKVIDRTELIEIRADKVERLHAAVELMEIVGRYAEEHDIDYNGMLMAYRQLQDEVITQSNVIEIRADYLSLLGIAKYFIERIRKDVADGFEIDGTQLMQQYVSAISNQKNELTEYRGYYTIKTYAPDREEYSDGDDDLLGLDALVKRFMKEQQYKAVYIDI